MHLTDDALIEPTERSTLIWRFHHHLQREVLWWIQAHLPLPQLKLQTDGSSECCCMEICTTTTVCRITRTLACACRDGVLILLWDSFHIVHTYVVYGLIHSVSMHLYILYCYTNIWRYFLCLPTTVNIIRSRWLKHCLTFLCLTSSHILTFSGGLSGNGAYRPYINGIQG